jgi:hypothetical protein
MSKFRSRSKWAAAKGRDTSYSGQFAGRLCRMLESPAYKVLSLAAHRVLARLEIELMRHGGNENGRLTVTYRQFEDYGVHKDSVAAAIRETVALGFVEVTERGCAGNAGYGKANQYRLTYRAAEGHPADGSHEWQRIKAVEDALAIQKASRRPPPINVLKRGGNRVRKIKPQSPFLGVTSPTVDTQIRPRNRGATGPISHPRNRGASSISRSEGSAAAPAARPAAPAQPPVAAPADAAMPAAHSQPHDEAEASAWTHPPR